MSYITEQGKRSLPVYKYKGEDRSLLYKWFGSPFAQYWVDHWTPRTAAPNTITLVGLLLQMLAYAVCASFSPDFKSEVPAWACYLSAICLFAYATLDNMDGKQARRVGASSPLGLLFDHGCDAINTGMVGSLVFAMVVQAGTETWRLYAMWACVVSVFFLNTWEEFHLREFILPVFNGPNEGLTLTTILMATTGYFGQHIWQQSVTPANGFSSPFQVAAALLRPVISALHALSGHAPLKAGEQPIMLDVVIAFSVVFVGLTCVWHAINVARYILVKAPVKGSGWDVAEAMARLSPIFLLNAICGLWLHLPACNAVVVSHPHIFMLTAGALFAEFTSKLMVSHVADQPYRPNFVGMALFLAAPLVQLGVSQGYLCPSCFSSLLVSPTPLLWASFSLAITLLATFLYFSVADIAGALDILVFDITKQLKRAEEKEREEKEKEGKKSQ